MTTDTRATANRANDYVTIAIGLVAFSALAAAQPGANPAAGRALFEGKGGCTACHTRDESSTGFGPDLSWIGILRTPAALRQSLVEPDAQLSSRYFTVVAETGDGVRVEGLAASEDDRSIQLRLPGGSLRSFLKADLRRVTREERSLMPSTASRLSAVEIDDLVAYLGTLRAIPPVEARERTREIGSVSENVEFFDRPGRDAEERSDDIVEALGIPAGAVVADVGSGTGYFTWRLARKVGSLGSVIAVDVQQNMLDRTAAAVKLHAATNVRYVLGSETNPRLPENALDLAFIAYTYHEFSEPELVMAAVRRSLKPGGRVFVLEFAKENRQAPASTRHKMSLNEIRSEIEPLGFELQRILDFLPVQHGLVFTRR